MINRNEGYIAGVLYKAAIEEEKEWRENDENMHDVEIVENLLQEVRKLGYRYRYFTDITHRDNTDKNILNIVLRYIGCFSDEAISALLVGVVGRKGNIEATETLIYCYLNRTKNKQHSAFFYDNAFYQIKDKRFISVYLEFLKNPIEANRFPLTMRMLGKWRISEAKPYFLQYLKLNDDDGDSILFASIEALSYYLDNDGSIADEFRKKMASSNKDIVRLAKKANKRLEKNS